MREYVKLLGGNASTTQINDVLNFEMTLANVTVYFSTNSNAKYYVLLRIVKSLCPALLSTSSILVDLSSTTICFDEVAI